MTDSSVLILPSIDSEDRLNTGIANPIDVQCMYENSQYAAFSGRFKPESFKATMTEKELLLHSKLSKDEIDDGISTKRIFTLRAHNPIDPYNSTYENVRTRGFCEVAMTRQYKLFTLGLEIARRLIAESRGDVSVDDKNMTEEVVTMNYQCELHHSRTCWCNATEYEPVPNIFDQCSEEKPFPLTTKCPHGVHQGRCFCVCDDMEPSGDKWSHIDVGHLNDCTTAEEQRSYLTDDCQLPCQALGVPSPFEAEDEPIIVLEMIPRETTAEVPQDGVEADIPLAIRFIYIIPENSTVSFGGVVQGLISEYGCKKRKTYKPPNQYQQHRNVKSSHSFLRLIGSVMWGKVDQYTNPQVNREFPAITQSEDNFTKGVCEILGFEYDLRSINGSLFSLDNQTRNFQQLLHKDTAKRCFRRSSYFQGNKFCPSMDVQRNMLLLDAELLELKNDHHILLKKYNLWHFLEQKEYYDRRFKMQEGMNTALPTSSTGEATDGIRRNPESMTSDTCSMLNTDVFTKDLPEQQQNSIRRSIRKWETGQIGAGMNTFRYRQKSDLIVYEDEGRHLKSNTERRDHYDKWIEDSVRSLKRYSNRRDLFDSTRGALDWAKNTQGWNPLILGFGKIASPSVGVGDMFVAELFYVSETLFYVSTHTGILFFCYVCTADAFCTRLNKNNWIFVGSPDGGKSFTSNRVKDAMLIKETILMKTKQSDAAMDDIDVQDMRSLMEEADMQLWYSNPKFANKQDEEKNRLTSGLSIAVKKQQFKGMDDIVRWHTRQIVTIHSVQIGCSTNETQLKKKGNKAMQSRVPMKHIPKLKRLKGRRGVSDMNSAKSQESTSKKRRADQFSNKYRYYDSLRFLVYKCINLGILTQPTRNAYDLIMDKLKAHLKGFGISLEHRTEDRCYGKAVCLMILRAITTLFEFPKPRADLMIVAMPYADTDPRKLHDKEFNFYVHEDDTKRIVDGLNLNDNFENVRLVNSSGQVLPDTFFAKMGVEKLYDENDSPAYFLRTVQTSPDPLGGKRYPHAPESLIGEFYKQWVSIHHSNFEHFVKCISPLMTISMEDTIRAIWLSRSEFVPDKYALFQKLLLRLGINCLKNEALRNPNDEKKRTRMFKVNRVEVSENSESRVDRTYVNLGPRSQVVASLAADNSKKGEETNTYPGGFEVYFDKNTIGDMLDDMRKVKDTQGYSYETATRILDDDTADDSAHWGVVKLSHGILPSWGNVDPHGNVGTRVHNEQRWRDFAVPETYSKSPPMYRDDWAKTAFARRQREEGSSDVPGDTWAVSKKHFMPVVEISDPSKGGRTDNSVVYLNINWIESNWKTRKQNLEDVNPLIVFFKSLGYRYDGIPITPAEKETFLDECRQRRDKSVKKIDEEQKQYQTNFQNDCDQLHAQFNNGRLTAEARDRHLAQSQKRLDDSIKEAEERKQQYEEVFKNDQLRLEKLVIRDDQTEADAGTKVLVGSPFLGYMVDENGVQIDRSCTPQLSMSVTIRHSETMWFTEAANVPSQKAAEILNLPERDTEKKRVDLVIPLNDFATMSRLDFLCVLPDGATVEDYKALYDLKFKYRDGVYYPYRFASPNYIRKQMHECYTKSGKEYTFTSAYPHDAAWHEEKSYDCIRKKINGTWVWVKYDIQRREANSVLRDTLRSQVCKDFDMQERRFEEVVCTEDVQGMSAEMTAHVDALSGRVDLTENPEEEELDDTALRPLQRRRVQ